MQCLTLQSDKKLPSWSWEGGLWAARGITSPSTGTGQTTDSYKSAHSRSAFSCHHGNSFFVVLKSLLSIWLRGGQFSPLRPRARQRPNVFIESSWLFFFSPTSSQSSLPWERKHPERMEEDTCHSGDRKDELYRWAKSARYCRVIGRFTILDTGKASVCIHCK